MANTNPLKNQIEDYVKNKFFQSTGFIEIKRKLKGFNPDIIAINNRTLILGEISVSGYMGGAKGGSHHKGGALKITDCYAKLDLLRRKIDFLRQAIDREFDEVAIYYITARGSVFKPTGWRTQLFSTCGFNHFEVDIDDKTRDSICDTIAIAKEEMSTAQ